MGVNVSAPWLVTPEKIEAAIKRLVSVSQPRRIVLFGSAAAGTLRRDSDLDLLVVTKKKVANPRREGVRLRRALRGISMPVDLLVISERRLAELVDRPGLIYREALHRGQVAYEEA
jgi:predicted nucleotidyltransferase